MVIAIAIAILCFSIFSIGHGSRLLTRSEIVEAHFHRINGLQTGAPVALSGVRIGAVDQIGFPSDPREAYVVVRMWVEQSAADRVRIDSLASISSMGLLGDKFVELSPGHPVSPAAEPGAVLPSRDPVDYESLLQKPGTEDLVSNLLAISSSMRSMLDAINQGNGLLSELIYGQRGDERQRLTLASVNQTLTNVNQMSSQMNELLVKLNRSDGIAGAMMSDRTNGRQFLSTIQTAAASLQKTSDRLDKFVSHIEQGQGAIPQLVENKQYADELLANMRESSSDLKQIARKINSGQGTLGLMVNDPTLYAELKQLLGPGSGGWALRMFRGLYSATHPFEGPAQSPPMTEAPRQ